MQEQRRSQVPRKYLRWRILLLVVNYCCKVFNLKCLQVSWLYLWDRHCTIKHEITGQLWNIAFVPMMPLRKHKEVSFQSSERQILKHYDVSTVCRVFLCIFVLSYLYFLRVFYLCNMNKCSLTNLKVNYLGVEISNR